MNEDQNIFNPLYKQNEQISTKQYFDQTNVFTISILLIYTSLVHFPHKSKIKLTFVPYLSKNT